MLHSCLAIRFYYSGNQCCQMIRSAYFHIDLVPSLLKGCCSNVNMQWLIMVRQSKHCYLYVFATYLYSSLSIIHHYSHFLEVAHSTCIAKLHFGSCRQITRMQVIFFPVLLLKRTFSSPINWSIICRPKRYFLSNKWILNLAPFERC